MELLIALLCFPMMKLQLSLKARQASGSVSTVIRTFKPSRVLQVSVLGLRGEGGEGEGKRERGRKGEREKGRGSERDFV